MDIKQLRNEIDEVDSDLLKLFLRRMELSRQIALWKKEEGKAIFDPVREEEKLKAIAEASGDEMQEYSARLWAEIMRLSKKYQEQI